MNASINWRKVVWALLLTPAAGCVGYVLLIVFWLVMNVRPPADGVGFYAVSFAIAAVIGGIFAAPVTLVVLPVVRCRWPGRDRISFLALAFSGLIFGILSPVVMCIIYASTRAFVIMENLLETLLAFGSMGAGSGLIMAVVWFFLTQPLATRPPEDPVVA